MIECWKRIQRYKRNTRSLFFGCVLNNFVQDYLRWKDNILYYELIVLDTLCFDLSIQHPQKCLLELEEQLKRNNAIHSYISKGYLNLTLNLSQLHHHQFVKPGCFCMRGMHRFDLTIDIESAFIDQYIQFTVLDHLYVYFINPMFQQLLLYYQQAISLVKAS